MCTVCFISQLLYILPQTNTTADSENAYNESRLYL
jgi:hypothetical protein